MLHTFSHLNKILFLSSKVILDRQHGRSLGQQRQDTSQTDRSKFKLGARARFVFLSARLTHADSYRISFLWSGRSRRLTPARPSFTCLQRLRPHSTRSFLVPNALTSTVQVSVFPPHKPKKESSSSDAHAGFWSVPCYSVKRIELSFDGNRFAIHPDDFYLGRVGTAGSTACVAAILSIANGLPPNLAIIGDVFLKSCAWRWCIVCGY